VILLSVIYDLGFVYCAMFTVNK